MIGMSSNQSTRLMNYKIPESNIWKEAHMEKVKYGVIALFGMCIGLLIGQHTAQNTFVKYVRYE